VFGRLFEGRSKYGDISKSHRRISSLGGFDTRCDVKGLTLGFDVEPPSRMPLPDIYHDFRQTMVEPNIWGAFRALGFEFDTRGEPYRLLFDEEKLRESTGFRELWSIDFPLDQLSVRRRNTKFGWINQPE
jgi:hypothetical protein